MAGSIAERTGRPLGVLVAPVAGLVGIFFHIFIISLPHAGCLLVFLVLF